MTYLASDSRYDFMPYRRTGRSGLQLPAVSLGLWQNFGHDVPMERQQQILRRAFDLGVTHIDLANNYGPPYGSAEANFGEHLRRDFAPYRDELVISSKAGYDMWPGPYGNFGSRKYLTASLDQSLARLGIDYVDIFYSHRADPNTPLEETMGALHSAVVSGKALYAGISSYSPARTREAAAILAELGTPLLIHQPSYSMFNRWIEDDLLDTLGELGVGCIAFSPLAQGLLTDRYLAGIPQNARAARAGSMQKSMINEDTLAAIRALTDIAAGRGQTLAQLAIAWTLRNTGVTSALVGASSVQQLEANLAAVSNLAFTAEELAAIDEHAVDMGINLWAESSAV
ncbi:L-glyceraldehyde 3-phosphate reductase [Lacisediminihabitans profunda]|uniref:L-glyceraldehyde 3-phosphate reductase n=1 Tax=Lacisediminihabitans profunda TaxID=2594790 RepID=A0A5C8UTK1_9MICO|nr:L-glyceraldehyde 3-phosphate reductase [Lacisediminihabitans profunda]TXN31924.1 L-glyceraldehyde 3-phosphate reductase [Lacisediminihabitans profunda]